MECAQQNSLLAGIIVDVIQQDLTTVLSAADRANLAEKIALMKGVWRKKSNDQIRTAACHAQHYYDLTHALPENVNMRLIQSALFSGINGVEAKTRRFISLNILHLAFAVIRGLEWEETS